MRQSPFIRFQRASEQRQWTYAMSHVVVTNRIIYRLRSCEDEIYSRNKNSVNPGRGCAYTKRLRKFPERGNINAEIRFRGLWAGDDGDRNFASSNKANLGCTGWSEKSVGSIFEIYFMRLFLDLLI